MLVLFNRLSSAVVDVGMRGVKGKKNSRSQEKQPWSGSRRDSFSEKESETFLIVNINRTRLSILSPRAQVTPVITTY